MASSNPSSSNRVRLWKTRAPKTEVVSPGGGWVKAWRHTEWGKRMRVDVPLEQAESSRYDAILLPGGVMNPDKLRINARALQFVRGFADAGKPIAAICHGPWILVDAGLAKGKTMTSWPSLQTDLRNAGAKWVDQEAVTDGLLVTSRKPDDIPAFNREMINLFAQATSQTQGAAASA